MNNWGWEMTCINMPRFKVINRAEPANPIMTALKGYFNPSAERKPGDAEAQLISMFAEPISEMVKLAGGFQPTSNPVRVTDTTVSDDPFLIPMQSIASKYSAISMLGFSEVTILVDILNEPRRFYTFSTKSGKVQKSDEINENDIGLKISSNSVDDFMDAIKNGDHSRLDIKNNLF
jgi:hypothetical protein